MKQYSLSYVVFGGFYAKLAFFVSLNRGWNLERLKEAYD